jgi:hypothetical protein
MAVRVSWKVLGLLTAIVLASLLLVAKVVGYYVHMVMFGIIAVVALGLLMRHGFRRAGHALSRRGPDVDRRRR